MYNDINLRGGINMGFKKVNPSRIMKGIKFYTVEDLSAILQISCQSVRAYLRKGKIGSVKVQQRFWVSEKNLSDFLLVTTIRDLPDKKLIETVNKMVELVFNEYIDNNLVPLVKDVIRELNEEKKEVIPEKLAEHIKSGLQVKKEFQKV